MTPVEYMALILSGLIVIKLIYLYVSPKKWVKLADHVYGNPTASTVVGFILAAGSLYYLLQEVTIVQIFAVFFLMMALIIMEVGPFNKEICSLAKKLYKDKDLMSKCWLPIVVWLVLSLWCLYVLLA